MRRPRNSCRSCTGRCPDNRSGSGWRCSARPESTRAQYSRLPESSPSTVARILAAKRSASRPSGPLANCTTYSSVAESLCRHSMPLWLPAGGSLARRRHAAASRRTARSAVLTNSSKSIAPAADQRDVAGAVAAAEIIAHGVDRQVGDALDGPQHAAAQRMLAEMGRLAFFVGAERRLVLVHLDFFDDHLLFGVEILFAQRRTQ